MKNILVMLEEMKEILEERRSRRSDTCTATTADSTVFSEDEHVNPPHPLDVFPGKNFLELLDDMKAILERKRLERVQRRGTSLSWREKLERARRGEYKPALPATRSSIPSNIAIPTFIEQTRTYAEVLRGGRCKEQRQEHEITSSCCSHMNDSGAVTLPVIVGTASQNGKPSYADILRSAVGA
jgi:hypothetical protein